MGTEVPAAWFVAGSIFGVIAYAYISRRSSVESRNKGDSAWLCSEFLTVNFVILVVGSDVCCELLLESDVTILDGRDVLVGE
jgi:hypothetical protein